MSTQKHPTIVTIYVRPVKGGYEVSEAEKHGATKLANEDSAMWAARAFCQPKGGRIVLQNKKGETVSTERVPAG